MRSDLKIAVPTWGLADLVLREVAVPTWGLAEFSTILIKENIYFYFKKNIENSANRHVGTATFLKVQSANPHVGTLIFEYIK